MKRLLKFSKKELQHFCFPTYRLCIPKPSSSHGDNSPNSWCGLLVPEWAIWVLFSKTWLCTLTWLAVPGGTGAEANLCFIPLRLEQLPRWHLLKAFKDIYYPYLSGTRNSRWDKQQTDQKAWEEGGWGGRYWGNKGLEGLLYILGNLGCNTCAQGQTHAQKRPERTLGCTFGWPLGFMLAGNQANAEL